MTTLSKFNDFVLQLGSKTHNLSSDALQIALCASANAPVATNTVLANLTEISYTNCSSRAVTTTSWTQASGTAKLLLAALVLTASGGNVATFRYIVLYNTTPAGKNLIGWYDYGADQVITNGNTFTIGFDQVNGALQLA